MRIAHVALWTADLDAAAAFWAEHFGATVGPLYRSARRSGFTSRFVTFADGAALELMSGPWVEDAAPAGGEGVGWAHIAIALGSPEAVRALSARLETAGLLVSPPRTTGDGFFEAVARTPEGVLVEITA